METIDSLGIKTKVKGQSLEGVKHCMTSEKKEMVQMCGSLLHNAKIFCSTLNRWIDLEWYKKFWHEDKGRWYENKSLKAFIESGGMGGLGMELSRQGKDMEMLVKAGIPGAARIWAMWLEDEAEVGEGLAAHGEIGNGRSRGENLTSTPIQKNSNDHILSRLIRDINSDETPEDRREELAELLDGIKDESVSVHRAAVKAGYRKEKTNYEKAVAAIRKCSQEEQEMLIGVINDLVYGPVEA